MIWSLISYVFRVGSCGGIRAFKKSVEFVLGLGGGHGGYLI